MIVFDLCCAQGGHRFEAWFSSSDSFADQQKRGLIACPICGDVKVEKAVMAPHVGAKSNQRADGAGKAGAARSDAAAAAAAADGGDAAVPQANMPAMAADGPAMMPEMIRHMMAEIAAKQAEALPKSRWVGNDFAHAARAMHEGRAEDQMIHGQSSPEDMQALVDDGIPAMPLLVPIVPPDKAN